LKSPTIQKQARSAIPSIRGLVISVAVALAGAANAGGAGLPPTPLTPAFTPAERTQIITVLSGDGAKSQDSDAELMAVLMAHGRRELGLRLHPSKIDYMWTIEPAPHDLAGEISVARANAQIPGWIARLPSPHAEYRQLLAARQSYAKTTSLGWALLPKGTTPKMGDSGPLVLALRARLAAEDYIVPAPAPAPAGAAAAASAPEAVTTPLESTFDEPLAATLALFQTRHGLTGDSVLGAATRAALNVPAATRLAQIDANLERWRWMPRVLPGDRLEVDIGDAQTTAFVAGAPALTMRSVVGKPSTKTPMFTSGVDSIVFNPPWSVPASIVSKEIMPKVAKDAAYLAKHHYVYVNGRLRQSPGDDAALGYLKFDFPSPFGVYLHDTPEKTAFTRDDRHLSHGCMRQENPRDLAALLLGWTRVQVDNKIDAKATERVRIAKPMPLWVVYRTAFVGPDGQLQFRADVYGWDAKLIRALAPAEALR
jgi:murein L,D-transpeptidase YcbB/YkuD